MNVNVCKACGSNLETRDVQMRSADEAHTSITSCPNCPVNPNKINSSKMPIPPLRGMTRRVRRSLPTDPRRIDNIRSIYTITVDIPLTHALMDIELDSHHLIQYSQFHNKRASDTAVNRLLSAFSVINGMFKGSCISFKDSRKIGMGITVDTYDVLASSENTGSQAIIKGMYSNWNKILNYDSYIYADYNEKVRKLIIELGYKIPSNYTIENIMNVVYGRGIIPDSIGKYVSTDTIAIFSNLSPRGWDASLPPETGYKFTCKPDGQNTWLFWIGNIWYKFNPRCKGGIKGWIWTDTSNNNDVVAISVEDMTSYGYIVIDCFTNEYGDTADSARGIEWVISTAQAILKRSVELPLIIREYFDNYESAVDYSNRVLYPVDGVVAIRNGSTEILKIKPVRSMELVLTENDMLTTAEGTHVIKCPRHISLLHKTGSILEIRFKVSKSNIIEVVDIFVRTDKDNANSDSAVSNVIRSAYKLLTPDDNERRVALLWCNNLRKTLYLSATNRNVNKNIIVDIGTGTGQSLDSIPQSESISYIFIEPDADRCRSIARRLNNRRIITNPAEIIVMMKSLKTRAVRHVIVNCSIGDILKNERVSDILFNETKSITCTFSMQFIVKELHYIVSTYKVAVYGCGYTYDEVNDNGILVNDCGVVMRQNSSSTAAIRWGNDKQYDEPMTLRRDYAGIGLVISGSEVIQLPDSVMTNGAFNICKHVTVVLP